MGSKINDLCTIYIDSEIPNISAIKSFDCVCIFWVSNDHQFAEKVKQNR